MASLDTTVPPHAITCWATDHDIVVMLPMKAGGTPYLIKFPLSEAGLKQALSVLIKRKDEVLSAADSRDLTDPRRSNILREPPPSQPQVKLGKIAERLHAETTEAQRTNARDLIAKMLGKKT